MAETTKTDGLHEVLGALESELEHLKAATEHIGESRKAASEAVKAASQIVTSSRSLLEATEALKNRIAAVDFPKRFDAVEGGIAKTGEDLGAVASRQDATSRALEAAQQERQALHQQLASAENERKQYFESMQTMLAKQAKEQRIWLGAIVALALLNLVLLIVL